MKREMRLRPGDDVRVVWLVAIAVLFAGSFVIQTRYQSAIAASHNRTESLYRRTAANERIVKDSARLEAVQKQAEHDLLRVSRDTSLSGTTAGLLATLHASAKQFRTRVLALDPAADASIQKTADASGQGLQAMALVMRVRGRFRDILGFVEDLSHHSTLISVSDTELSLANDVAANQAQPQLEATIHATLYRLALARTMEDGIATDR